MDLKAKIKKLLHWHRYTELRAYPPRHNDYWGFLIKCNCGHTKLANLPHSITVVYVMHSKEDE